MPVQQAPDAVNNVPYVLDNDEPTAASMLDHLSVILDDHTHTRLSVAGVPAGGRCLEVGAGNGSVAGWLGKQVGPNGTVVAVDIKPQHVRPHPRVQVVGLNIEADEVPPGPYDVIHARLLLAHLPTRGEVLARLVEQLAADGVLVVQDWGRVPGRVLTSSVPDAASVYRRYHNALLRVFEAAGNDTTWAERTAEAMTEVGLTDIDAVVHADAWRGSTPGCLLPTVVARELSAKLIDAGASVDDLDALVAVMAHPDTLLLGNPIFSTIGRRAEM